MSDMNILVRSVEEDAWIPLGPKPYKGLPRKGSIIEIEQDGQTHLYRILSAHPPMDDEDGALLVEALGTKLSARETLYRDVLSD